MLQNTPESWEEAKQILKELQRREEAVTARGITYSALLGIKQVHVWLTVLL